MMARPPRFPAVSVCIGFSGPVCSARSLLGTPSLEGMSCSHRTQHLVTWPQLAARKDSGQLLSGKFDYHERRGKGGAG